MKQPYILERTKRRKRLALHVTPTGDVIAKAPWTMPKMIVEHFIKQKQAWIAEQRIGMQTKIHPFLLPLMEDGFFYYLGEKVSYSIELGKKNQLVWEEKRVIIQSTSMVKARKLVLEYFKTQTQYYVVLFVDKYQSKLKHGVNQINYKTYKRRWGSCDTHNNLMFNTMLSSLDLKFVEYVVVHELAHLTQKHHQKSFYAEGERLLKGFIDLDKKMR